MKKNRYKTPENGVSSQITEISQPPQQIRAQVDPITESRETFMDRGEVKTS